jgi:hypothetical protein
MTAEASSGTTITNVVTEDDVNPYNIKNPLSALKCWKRVCLQSEVF